MGTSVKVTSSRVVLVGGETTVNWTVVRAVKCPGNVRKCRRRLEEGRSTRSRVNTAVPLENVTLVTPPNIGTLDRNLRITMSHDEDESAIDAGK